MPGRKHAGGIENKAKQERTRRGSRRGRDPGLGRRVGVLVVCVHVCVCVCVCMCGVCTHMYMHVFVCIRVHACMCMTVCAWGGVATPGQDGRCLWRGEPGLANAGHPRRGDRMLEFSSRGFYARPRRGQ